MHFLKFYIKNSKIYSPVKFIIVSTFIAIIGKFAMGALIGLLTVIFDINSDELLKSGLEKISSPIYLFLIMCIIAPVIETIIFQWLPIELLQKITSNIKLIIGIDAMLFACAHLFYSFFYTLAVLPLALVLAWSFIAYSNDSISKAFWLTASIHTLYNFSAYLSLAFF